MNLCVIIVLYNPTIDQVKNKANTLKNISTIFIDNSESPFSGFDLSENFLNFHYIHNEANIGIAAAHNKAIKIAKTLYKADYVLLLDQDSDPGPSFIDNSLKDIQLAKDLNFAVIAPQLVNLKNHVKYKLDLKGNVKQNFKIAKKSSSSGSLIPVKAFNAVGDFKESLFIDLVDSEWCWRANSLGYVCLVSNINTLFHDIGEQDIHFLGLHFIRSKPIRMFYQYRNWLLLIKEKHVPIKWKLTESIKKILFIVLIFFHSPTKQDIYQIIRGIFEGIRYKLE
jgi:rhamnosyltransferase